MKNGEKKEKLSKIFSDSFLKKSHKFCRNNVGKNTRNSENKFGCFYCRSFFSEEKIKETTDDDKTVLCPNCGVDSVFNLSAFLQEMCNFWFGKTHDMDENLVCRKENKK